MSKRPVATPAVGAAGRRGTRVVLLVVVAALALAGCGGDEEEQTTAATQATTQATATGKPETQERGGASEKTQPPQTTKSAPQSTVPDAGPTPGAKAAARGVPVSPGGDNSIQTYGTEGENDQRMQASIALTTYLDARLIGQWSKACAEMSNGLKRSLQMLVREKDANCETTIRALTAGVPKSALRRVAQVKEVLSFRAEGEQAFLIFRGVGDTVKYSTMVAEDGQWKVGAIEPSELFLGP